MASRRSSKSARARKKKKPQKVRAQWRDELNDQLADHRGDMVAIALGVVGLLSLLAIFSDAIGPVGRGIDAFAAAFLGKAKVLVPIALLFGSVATLARHRVDDEYEDEETSGRKGLRLGIGLTLVCAASVGLFYMGN